ncbi:gastrula zinc finger protein XlCGF49.1-like [Topomyia yanbarensis]|uniref:gastrula zinc finger protein XlCGF49.1-like n=1 Tax=Topomyia yanbarensis TaxID=2498891 RepID=UPI00273CE0B3|nr:gastrula zinc finger protein XlCGF49.1-like [Topomyia yanbarensis]
MTSYISNLDTCKMIAHDNIGVIEEVQPFRSGLDGNEQSSPVEVFINELFEKTTDQVKPAEENFVCEACFKRFDDPKKLMRHKKTHCQQQKLKCLHCGVYLKSRSSYSSHLQRHKNGRRFECEMCGKCFADKRDLRAHQMVHDPQAERFRCDTCGKDFSRIYSLLDHQKLHSGQADFSCVKCGKVFPKRRSLLLHERSHLLEEGTFK